MPNTDVMGIKIDIITAAFDYARAMELLGRESAKPIKDNVSLIRDATAKYQVLFTAINQIDSLVKE